MTEQQSALLRQVQRLKAQQAAREGAELERLVNAYKGIYSAVKQDAGALSDYLISRGQIPTSAQLMKLSRYRELMDTVEKEMEQYQAFMRVELRSHSTMAITDGERDARTLAQIAAREVGLNVGFRALNTEVISQIVGFLAPDGPLYERLGLLSGWTKEQVAQAIIDGIAKGLNPRTTAALLTKTLDDGVTKALGMGLTDSLRMMRTVQLYSYREANRASYLANQDVVTGWIWYAELDGDTCASCVAMHGTQHELTETLDDHHNGRCAMLPLVVGASNDLEGAGKSWFDGLSEQEQRGILGKGKFEAWKEGKFQLSDIPTTRPDYVYGAMRQEKTLQELTGGE